MSLLQGLTLSVVFKGATAVAVGGLATYATIDLDIGAAVVGLAAGTATLAVLPEVPKYIRTFRDWSHL